MSKASILIVEDERIVAKDLQNRLKRLGYNVLAIAFTGEQAINKAAELRPDLVLMDINLKGSINGIKAAREIYTRLDIPSIYLTANADRATFEQARQTEPLGYLLKPFKEIELDNTIEINLARFQAEKKLKENEQWLAAILKSIGDGVIATDRTGAVIFMNSVAETLTGWKQQEALNLASAEVFNIINATSQTEIDSPVSKSLRTGTIVGLPENTLLLDKNGVAIPIDDSAAPIKDSSGNITGVVLTFRDITEVKKAQEIQQKQIEQQRLVEQLEKINQLKDDFLNTVSHELRTPITNMKMALQMLKFAKTEEKSQRYLQILQNECDRESALIDNLLDLQRIESASYPSNLFEALIISDWISSIIEPFRIRAGQRQQVLHINLTPNLPPLFIDRASLERILAELLNNACKYTPAGGEIILKARFISAQAATIFAISNPTEIPSNQLPRIFDRFYRVPNADPWKQGGTGLGLALVKKLVEKLQGTISVESKHGWTTFNVELPNQPKT